MTPSQVADRYFECIRAKDVEGLVALYAADAHLVFPDGREFSGEAAIRQVQENIFATIPPIPTPGPRIVGESAVAVEIETRLPDGSRRRTANFFHLNDAGRIQRLNVYWQGS
jgi:hypothetical protein